MMPRVPTAESYDTCLVLMNTIGPFPEKANKDSRQIFVTYDHREITVMEVLHSCLLSRSATSLIGLSVVIYMGE